jgi:hypothetical protein
MSLRRPPRIAHALLRWLGGRYQESLEGDLLEEFAAGRSHLWFWHQVACALREQAWRVVRQQATTFAAAFTFFLLALWAIAPATYPVMRWSRTLESLDFLVLVAWLAGVPFVLGSVAGSTERRRYTGAILLAGACAYLTPLTLPFTTAACDLCTRSQQTAPPGVVFLLTPFASALLVGLGAWVAARITSRPARGNADEIA